MATLNRTFSVKNGIDVANTIIVDSSRNLSNIVTANATTVNSTTFVTSAGLNVTDQANNAYAAANSAANTARVSANGGSTLSARQLNFINTGSIQVTVSSAGDGTNANISFITTGAAVADAYGQANAAYGQANAARDQANTARSDANTTFATINTTFATLNTSAGSQNTAITNAHNAANTSGNTVRVSANAGSTLSNRQLNFNNTASIQVTVADSGDGNANITFATTGAAVADAYAQANAAFAQANNARTDANAAANLVAVYANNSLVIADANVNFNNTATINVSVTANVSTNRGNIEFNANSTALGIPAINSHLGTINTTFGTVNTSLGTINTHLGTINTTFGTVNTTFGTVNTTFGSVNTAITNAHNQANAARGQANTAYGQANDAYAAANTKLPLVGGSISGDLTISGNLVVQGNATTINVSNLSVNDSIILLANGGTGDASDIGFVGHIDRAGVNTHVGLIRKATLNEFYLFDNYEVEPTNNIIDISGNNFRVGNLRLNTINANSVLILGQAAATQANLTLAHNQANAARDQANSAFGAANNRVLRAGDSMTGALSITTSGIGLTVANANVTFSLQVGTLNVTTNTVTTAASGQVVLDTFPTTQLASAKYFVQANSSTNYHTTEIVLVNDATNVYLTEYASIQSGPSLGSFSADITSGNVRLLFTATNNINTIRAVRYGIIP